MSRRLEEIVRRPTNRSHASSTTTAHLIQQGGQLLEKESDDCEVQAEHVLNNMNRCFYTCFPIGAEYHTDEVVLDRLEAKINLMILIWAHRDKVEALLAKSSWDYDREILFNIDKRLTAGQPFDTVCEILFRKIAENGWIMNLFRVAPWGCLLTNGSILSANEAQKENILLSIVAKVTTTMEPFLKEKPDFEKELDRKFRPELEAARHAAENERSEGRVDQEQYENGSSKSHKYGFLEEFRERAFLPRWEGSWNYKRSVEQDNRLMKRANCKDNITYVLLPPPPIPPHRTVSMPVDNTAGVIQSLYQWQQLTGSENSDTYRRSSRMGSMPERQLKRVIKEDPLWKARPSSEEIAPSILRSSSAPIQKITKNSQDLLVEGSRRLEPAKKWKGRNLFAKDRTTDQRFM